MLVKHFMGRLNRLRGKSVKGISQEALSLLMFHDYPGNIRELENIIEHAFVLCPEGQIETHCLPDNLWVSRPLSVGRGKMDTALKSTEAQLILDTLEQNGYNRVAAARDLGIHKSTLFRKMKALGMKPARRAGRVSRG